LEDKDQVCWMGIGYSTYFPIEVRFLHNQQRETMGPPVGFGEVMGGMIEKGITVPCDIEVTLQQQFRHSGF